MENFSSHAMLFEGSDNIRKIAASEQIVKTRDNIYKKAQNSIIRAYDNEEEKGTYSSYTYNRLSDGQKTNVDKFLTKCNKSIYTMLITQLLYKTVYPHKNILYWCTGKDPDTDWIRWGCGLTKFCNEYIRKFLSDNNFQYALDSSGSTLIPHSISKYRKIPLKLSHPLASRPTYAPFFQILDDVQEKGFSPDLYLQTLFEMEILRQKNNEKPKVIIRSDAKVTCRTLISMMNDHLYEDYTHNGTTTQRGTSKLPVLMVHSLFEVLLKRGNIPSGIWLEADRPHTANDTKDDECGDVTLRNNDGSIYMAIDIKGNDAEIKASSIIDAVHKIEKAGGVDTSYYFVYTDPPHPNEQLGIEMEIDKASRQGYDIDVISVRDLFRRRFPLLTPENRIEFLRTYRNYLEKDAKKNGFHELQDFHREKFDDILKAYDLAETVGKDKAENISEKEDEASNSDIPDIMDRNF